MHTLREKHVTMTVKFSFNLLFIMLCGVCLCLFSCTSDYSVKTNNSVFSPSQERSLPPRATSPPAVPAAHHYF